MQAWQPSRLYDLIDQRSQAKRLAEFQVDRFHLALRHGAQFPIDQRPFNGSEDPGHRGREEQPGLLPVGYQMIAEETASDVTGDSCYNDFLP